MRRINTSECVTLETLSYRGSLANLNHRTIGQFGGRKSTRHVHTAHPWSHSSSSETGQLYRCGRQVARCPSRADCLDDSSLRRNFVKRGGRKFAIWSNESYKKGKGLKRWVVICFYRERELLECFLCNPLRERCAYIIFSATREDPQKARKMLMTSEESV